MLSWGNSIYRYKVMEKSEWRRFLTFAYTFLLLSSSSKIICSSLLRRGYKALLQEEKNSIHPCKAKASVCSDQKQLMITVSTEWQKEILLQHKGSAGLHTGILDMLWLLKHTAKPCNYSSTLRRKRSHEEMQVKNLSADNMYQLHASLCLEEVIYLMCV